MQSARDEQQAAREYRVSLEKPLAAETEGSYTEKEKESFWERLFHNDSFYSPYQDLLEFRQRRDEARHALF